MAEPGSTLATGVRLVTLLLEEAKKQGTFEKLKTVFKKKPIVLLLGATGAGKSNLLQSLYLERPEAIARSNRTVYPEPKLLTIKGKHPYRFIDTPGDSFLKDGRVEAIRKAMSARGGISGVINVVSYGYHEYHVPEGKVFLADGAIDPHYLEQHRQYELDQLDEWTPLLGSPVTIKWLITVVTKADLWWNDREEVEKYYKKGPYYAALKDAQTVRPRVVPYSSVFSKFYGKAPLSGYFDENDRDKLKRQLIQALLSALLQDDK
jgi:energy-coupling factor transporter ATP-binding protein EcfA2